MDFPGDYLVYNLHVPCTSYCLFFYEHQICLSRLNPITVVG